MPDAVGDFAGAFGPLAQAGPLPVASAASWLGVSSGWLIGPAYLALAAGLAFLLLKRRDFPFRGVATLFAVFLLAAGATHLIQAAAGPGPSSGAVEAVELLTALAAWSAVLVLVPSIPEVLDVASPDELNREVAERTSELIRANKELQRASEGRSDALERLHGVLDQAVVGIVTFNEQGRIEFANPAAAAIFGFSRDELLGWDVAELMPEATGREDSLADFLHTGDPDYAGSSREAVGRRKTGEEFDIELAVSELRLPGRRLFTGIFRDVTARRAAERALRENQAYLDELIKTLPLFVWTSDPDGAWVYLSPQWEQYTGVAAGERLGDQWLQSVQREDRERVAGGWKGAVAEGTVFDAEFRVRRADGAFRWFKARAVPLRGDVGEVVRWFGTATDVDDLKRAEASAAHGLSQLRAVVSTIADGVVVADRQGHILLWNPAAQRIHGYTRIDDVPDDVDHLSRAITLATPNGAPVPADDWPLARILRGETLAGCELAVRRQGDGRELIVQYDGALAPGPDGEPALAVLTLRDVTDRRRAEGEWRRTAQLLQAVVDGVSDAVFVKDRQGRYLLFNPAAARFVGRPAQEVLGQDDSTIHSAAEAARIAERDRAVMTAGAVETSEETLTVGNATRTFLVTRGPYRDASGAIAGVVGVAHDISARKRAEDTLRASEARFRLLVDGVKDFAIFLIAADGRIATWTAAAERMLGYRADEIVGQPISKLHPPSETARVVAADELKVALVDGRFEGEEWRVRKDGTRFWASVVVTSLREPSGKPQAFVAMIRDLSERRRADALLQSIMDSVLDGVIGLDESGVIRFVNHAAERLFAQPASELVGTYAAALVGGPHRAEAEDFFARVKNGQALLAGEGYEGRARRQDGSEFPVDLSVSEFVLDDGRYFTAVVRDVSDRLELEADLRRSQKMEALGQLAGGVAHDFNNRLTVINGYSEMALDFMSPADPHRPALSAIREAGERAAALTSQLLAFGRRRLLEPRVVDPNTVVADACKLLKRLIREDVVLHVVPAVRPGRIRVDPAQLGQVLTTLALNARDAMPQGGRLTIATRDAVLSVGARHDAPTRYVMISVSDTGVGMSDEVKKRIFEPLFTTKTDGKGTAMGLATAYGVVQQSGGRIELESELGVGTTFRMYFPTVGESDEPSPATREISDRRGSETVLLVEDQDDVRAFGRQALETHGYRVLEASGAEAALQLVERAAPTLDLLVTDVVMPGLDGRRLAEELRNRYPALRVLYLSGYTDDTILRHGVAIKDVAFLAKPYGAASLTQKVREVLDAP